MSVTKTAHEDPEAVIRMLEDELALTNREVMTLTLELDKRVEERTAELRATQQELWRANTDLLQLTAELEDRVAERTRELEQAARETASLLERLAAAERQYRRLAENAPDIIARYELRPRRGFGYLNSRMAEITGYSLEEHYADPDLWLRIVHPDDRGALEAILRGEGTFAQSVTMRWIRRDGATIWIEQRHTLIAGESGRPRAVECIARDISERKLLEDQLRQSQKMEAIGRLAGGVAHDFNNLLTVISGYSANAQDELDPSSPLYADLEEIGKAADRAAALTRQLLAFSRRQVFAPQRVDLNAIVADMDRMLRRVLGEDVELATALDAGLQSVHADRGQIEQVIMNLAVNARDAMPRGGRLLIETANVELDRAFSGRRGGIPPGPYAMLAVTDTGTGMDRQTLAKIFEPFFTTKPAGQGTGLGLATVYGIVKQNGGDIWVYSEPGKGSTFKVYLPRSAELAETPQRQPAAPPAAGTETILIVEDEESIRRLIQTALKRAGYKVFEARSGLEALELCAAPECAVHLVITDIVMPEMSGQELARQLAEHRPHIKVLFMSGYTDTAIVQHGALDVGTPFLQKPFTPATLSAKVREALNR